MAAALDKALTETAPRRAEIGFLQARAAAALDALTSLGRALASVVARNYARLVVALVPHLPPQRPLLVAEARACLSSLVAFVWSTGDAGCGATEMQRALEAVATTLYRPRVPGETARAQLSAFAEVGGAVCQGLKRAQVGFPSLVDAFSRIHAGPCIFNCIDSIRTSYP